MSINFQFILRHFTVNEEFHPSRSGLCDNYMRKRLEAKIIMQLAIAQFCLKREIVSRERANNFDKICKEVKSILGLFQSQREELQYPLS